MSDKSIINKINALLMKTVENGASEAEAEAALRMAQKLMEKHTIEESQLADHAKDTSCNMVEVDMHKTGYDHDPLTGGIGNAFDCKCWWNRYQKKVYFFGFADDPRLAAYFYVFLNHTIEREARRYRNTFEFAREKMQGYHTKTIMASFRKGMIARLRQRLIQLKRQRKSNIAAATGRDLVVVKEQTVQSEYDALDVKPKAKKSQWRVENDAAFRRGVEKADDVNMAGGIEDETKRGIR